jgi:hypothetical protein
MLTGDKRRGQPMTFEKTIVAVLAIVAAAWLGHQVIACVRVEVETKRVTADQCTDATVMMSTSWGSPSAVKCPHQRHRVRVAETRVFNEALAGNSVATVVVCECVGDAGVGAP